MLNPRELLDIIEVVIYIPALIFSVVVTSRHGLRRSDGWIFLVILAVIRLIGGVTGVIGFYKQSTGLAITTIILNTIGLSPLLIAMLGILRRIAPKMPRQISARYFRLAYLPTLAGFILAIVAGVDASSSNSSTVSQSSTFSKIAVALFLVAFVVQSIMTWTMFPEIRFLDSGEQKLLYAVGFSTPFLALRIAFSFLVTFGVSSDSFSLTGDSQKQVIVQALMAIAPEFIVDTAYLISGLLLPVHASKNMRAERVYRRDYQQEPMPGNPPYENIGETHAMLVVDDHHHQNDYRQPAANPGHHPAYEPFRGEA